jgi:hypothetical protein
MSPPGKYPTMCSGAVDTNYSGINYINGTDTASAPIQPIAIAGKTQTKSSTTTTTTTTAAPSVTPTPVAGATNTHTGEPWGGSAPWVLAVIGSGVLFLALGEFLRRRSHS